MRCTGGTPIGFKKFLAKIDDEVPAGLDVHLAVTTMATTKVRRSRCGWAAQADAHNVFAYRGLTSDGRRLRCSSVYFRNPAGRIIAALRVNYDVSMLAQARALIDDLLTDAGTEIRITSDEYIGQDLMAVMDAMIAEAIGELGKPVDRMSRADRIAVITRLGQQGATQMRNGVETIAKPARDLARHGVCLSRAGAQTDTQPGHRIADRPPSIPLAVLITMRRPDMSRP